ncbi:MAG: M23 family metallopeptidase [Myxococcota bacterium]
MNRTRIVLSSLVALLLIIVGLLVQLGLLDRMPPEVEVRLPDGPLRQDVQLYALVWDQSPGVSSVTVQLDDRPPEAVPVRDGVVSWTLQTAGLDDGLHRLTVTGTDGAFAQNQGKATVLFESDNAFPTLEIATAGLVAVQGRTQCVLLRTAEPLASLTGAVFGKGRRFYEIAPGVWRALVGVEIRQETGHHAMTLEAVDVAGNVAKAEIPIRVEAGDFPAGGTIRLTRAQTEARRDTTNRDKTRKEREDAYRVRDDVQRWSAPMLRPVRGRRSSAFGRYRTYSDGHRSYHSGTDLANVTGTPVSASAAGIVRQAGWEHIFGNVVIVDHGQGVSTSYNHLSAVDVTVGQPVDRGDTVGEVGSTGQSTGPHLHWGLVVDGVAVDAEQWLDRTWSPEEFSQFIDLSQIEGGAIWDGAAALTDR